MTDNSTYPMTARGHHCWRGATYTYIRHETIICLKNEPMTYTRVRLRTEYMYKL